MPVITVDNVSKRYRKSQTSYHTLREDIYELTGRIISLGGNKRRDRDAEHIWALRDVSFEVERGERLGIIGPNGSGKTTLLRLLAGITRPTKGKITIMGRLGALIELMAGFHPELTGRDNIYLNGTIIGMSRKDIRRKFDEIVAFSGLEEFIDTPIKRYSSGMQVRLGFAVAAHLEPEILLVDEVLAVGDAQFQKKCLGKMGSAAQEGRTVVFVSHNMQAVRQLCQRAILLEAGRLVADGAASEVTDKYLREIPVADTKVSLETLIRSLPPDPALRLDSIGISQAGRPVANMVLNGEPLEIEIGYEVKERTTGLRVFFDLCDNEDTLLFRSFHDESSDGIPAMEPGHYISRAVIQADLLAPRIYELRVLATVFNVRMCIPYPGVRIPLNVERTGKSNRSYLIEPIRGKLAPVVPWTTSPVEDKRLADPSNG